MANGELQNFRSIQELLAAFYGGALISQPEETDYVVGTGPMLVGAGGPGMRIGVVLSNAGATDLAISFRPLTTVSTGIVIAPKANFRFDWYYDGDLVSRPLYAISSAGGGRLHLLERFLTGA